MKENMKRKKSESTMNHLGYHWYSNQHFSLERFLRDYLLCCTPRELYFNYGLSLLNCILHNIYMYITFRPKAAVISSAPPPSSAPVNLLRTLHFDQQFTGTGLFLTSRGCPEIPRELSDINHNAPPEISTKFGCPLYGQPEFSYKLAAVVCHLGDVQLGHFVTYRRGVHDGGVDLKGASSLSPKWWLTSDSTVRRVSTQQVFSSEAYMLFYERIVQT